MLKVHKRLDRLEGSLLPKSAAPLWDTISSKTLQHITTPDLAVLISIAEDDERGTPRTQFTEREEVALAAYWTALEQELHMAGVYSMAEFEKLFARRR